MKKIITLCVTLMLGSLAFAQKKETDSIPKTSVDTVRIGGITIVVKKKNGKKEVDIIDNNDSAGNNTVSTFRKNKKKSNTATSWFTFDFGFTNYTDNTNYSTVGSYIRSTGTQAKPTASDFDLRGGKSIGVNFWLVRQKVNIAKKYVAIKYCLGIEHLNYRFNSSVSYINASPSYATRDSISFSKNKLGINYLSVPLSFHFNPDGKDKFSFSAGISAGYKINSFNKQKSSDRGQTKRRGEFDLNPIKLALIGDIGTKLFRVYGSYNLTNLYKDRTNGMDVTPWSVGIKLNSW